MRTKHEKLMKKKNCRLCGRDLTEIFGRHAKKCYCPACKQLTGELYAFIGGISITLISILIVIITNSGWGLLGTLTGLIITVLAVNVM